jgi:hypothetical protein
MEGNGMKTGRIATLVVAVALGAGAVAHADDFSYKMGRQLGEQTARSAWRNVRTRSGCSGLGDLRSTLKRSSRRIARNASRSGRWDVADYARGYVRGLWAVFGEVADHCPSRCDSVDEMAESISDQVYGDVVKSVGAVPQSVWRQDLPRGFCRRG